MTELPPPRDVYSHGHHESVLRSHRWRTAENSAGYLLPYLRPADRVLDIGTGPGTITVGLAGLVPDGAVTGIDNADAAVASTRQLAAEQGLPNLTAEAGDVYALGYADGAFDVVHAHQVLQHLSDPVAALREMARVCRAGGLVAVRDADYAAMTWYPSHPGLDRWLALYQEVARANRAEPDAGRRLGSWVRQAGLRLVSSEASAWCFSRAEDVAWWSQTWAERLRASAFAAQAQHRGLSTAAELAELSAAWHAWAAHPDAWFAVLHGEVLAAPARDRP